MLSILDTFVNRGKGGLIRRSLSLAEEVEKAQLISATLSYLARSEGTDKWNAVYAKMRQRDAAEAHQAMEAARRRAAPPAWSPQGRTVWERLWCTLHPWK